MQTHHSLFLIREMQGTKVRWKDGLKPVRINIGEREKKKKKKDGEG